MDEAAPADESKYSPKIYGEFAAETFHQGLDLGK